MMPRWGTVNIEGSEIRSEKMLAVDLRHAYALEFTRPDLIFIVPEGSGAHAD